MKILLPVDGSPCSERALARFIASLAWFNGSAEIHLLYVHLPIPLGRGQGVVGHQQVEDYYRDEGLAQLVAARGRLSDAGLSFVTHVHVGQPAEVIVKFAREHNCDLICMGSHGHTALVSAVLGSVTSQVMHLADRPVMLLK